MVSTSASRAVSVTGRITCQGCGFVQQLARRHAPGAVVSLICHGCESELTVVFGEGSPR
jgi:hypothetical protein